MGCKMSLKIRFLHSHLDFFPDNFGAVSDEQGERFHQDILKIEQRYKGRFGEYMMSDYCWFLQREDPSKHDRKSNKNEHQHRKLCNTLIKIYEFMCHFCVILFS